MQELMDVGGGEARVGGGTGRGKRAQAELRSRRGGEDQRVEFGHLADGSPRRSRCGGVDDEALRVESVDPGLLEQHERRVRAGGGAVLRQIIERGHRGVG